MWPKEKTMTTEKLAYRDGDVALEAHVAWDETRAEPRPAVLIAHAFAGQGDFERQRAERLAELGYVGIALDNYGKGVFGRTRDECTALMRPFLDDRGTLQRRLLAGFEAAKRHPRVDASRIGAMGFCFGGLCALDLARSGADLRGVVSFHGLLRPSGLEKKTIAAKVLVLHGHDDPMVPPEQVLAFEREMTEAGADWQVHVYGGTVHSFTNPEANNSSLGTAYQPSADRRSWASMRLFFEEALAASR
jgi:dienelactone hydrolase